MSRAASRVPPAGPQSQATAEASPHCAPVLAPASGSKPSSSSAGAGAGAGLSGEWHALLLALLVERALGAQSFWAPYLALLPDQADHPLLWSAEQVRLRQRH